MSQSPVEQKAVVVSDLIGEKAGAYRATLLLCRELAALGLDVTCFATWVEPDLDVSSEPFAIRQPRIRRGCRWQWPHRSLARGATAHIRRDRPGHVFVVGLTRLCREFLKGAAASRALVWELTGGAGGKFVDDGAVQVLGRCRGVLVPTEGIGAAVRKNYGFSGRIECLPFWVEDAGLPCRDAPLEEACDFLFLGRREDDKGIPELLEAVASLKMTHPDVRVCLGGFGDAGPYQRRAKELGIGSQVDFPDLADRGVAMEVLAKARFLVLPSHHEGYPLVLLEAAQRSVPVIATAVGAIPEAFGDSLSAVLVPPREANALASAMAQVLEESPDQYLRRRRAAWERFRELSSAETVGRRLVDLLSCGEHGRMSEGSGSIAENCPITQAEGPRP